MMASMVTLLMMPMTLVNQAVVTLGLKAYAHVEIDGARAACPSSCDRKSWISVVMICWA